MDVVYVGTLVAKFLAYWATPGARAAIPSPTTANTIRKASPIESERGIYRATVALANGRWINFARGLIRYATNTAKMIMKKRFVSEEMTEVRKSRTASSRSTRMVTRTIDRAVGDDDTSDTRCIFSENPPRMFSFES